MAAYPEWVNQFRRPGTTVKKVGATYYLYKTKSVRIPGKKNPQPQSEYLGVITQDGVRETGIEKVQTSVVRVYEYGFSYAMKALMPDKMTKDLGGRERADEVVVQIVRGYSPGSYLLRGRDPEPGEDFNVQIPVQKKKFSRLKGIEIEDLLLLREIYLVELGDHEYISEISPECAELLGKVGVVI